MARNYNDVPFPQKAAEASDKYAKQNPIPSLNDASQGITEGLKPVWNGIKGIVGIKDDQQAPTEDPAQKSARMQATGQAIAAGQKLAPQQMKEFFDYQEQQDQQRQQADPDDIRRQALMRLQGQGQ